MASKPSPGSSAGLTGELGSNLELSISGYGSVPEELRYTFLFSHLPTVSKNLLVHPSPKGDQNEELGSPDTSTSYTSN